MSFDDDLETLLRDVRAQRSEMKATLASIQSAAAAAPLPVESQDVANLARVRDSIRNDPHDAAGDPDGVQSPMHAAPVAKGRGPDIAAARHQNQEATYVNDMYVNEVADRGFQLRQADEEEFRVRRESMLRPHDAGDDDAMATVRRLMAQDAAAATGAPAPAAPDDVAALQARVEALEVRNAELETHLTRDGTNKLKSAIEALDRDDKRFLVLFCFPFPSVV